MILNLKRVLKSRNMTPAELGRRIKKPKSTVYAWVEGLYPMNYDALDAVCEALQCNVGDILEVEWVQPKLE